MAKPAFRDNATAHRFELEAPEGLSFADYRDVAGVRAIMHVETPPAAQGLGYATRLMNEVVAHARKHGLKLRASCAFAAAYFKRHSDAADVLA
jgi:predicted GNAT family acetyltransferase